MKILKKIKQQRFKIGLYLARFFIFVFIIRWKEWFCSKYPKIQLDTNLKIILLYTH